LAAIDQPSVRRVAAALAAAGLTTEIIELAASGRTAVEAAAALGVDVGAIVKSLVFVIDGDPVMALVSGDRRCREEALPSAFGRDGGHVARANAAEVRAATGFAIGGVAPIGLTRRLDVVIDASLRRFETLYAAAGHPHCVFPTTLSQLLTLTRGRVSEAIAAPAKDLA
jgi:prolyl-tRNA editing enzyme YbaK/EbsC (Cys-tRNA(Pro) deacylase)